MRRSTARRVLLLTLAVSLTAAAQQYVRVWQRIAPEDEEFAVHMPEPNFRVRRELPFGGGVMLKPASFEITNAGTLFSVLSFAKSQPSVPKTFGAFIKGFERALVKGAGSGMVFERELNLDGRAGRRFRLKVGAEAGAASVYETESHFYVVLTLGSPENAAAAEHFHNSFTFDRAGADRVPVRETVAAPPTPPKQPAPLWPVAGDKGAIGIVVGDRDPANQGPGASVASLPDIAGKTVISGGVLNGKTLAKPQPPYPPIAKAARAQGTVTVQVLVDEEGYVIAASAVSGHPLLQQASVFAARQTRFSPTLLEGQPVKVSGVITYNFVLQ